MAYQIDTYLKDFSSYIESAGVTSFYAEMLTVFINAFIFILLLAFLDKLLKKVIVEVFKVFSNKTKTSFDDFLILTNFPRYVGHIIPLAIFKWFFVELLDNYPTTLYWLLKVFDMEIC